MRIVGALAIAGLALVWFAVPRPLADRWLSAWRVGADGVVAWIRRSYALRLLASVRDAGLVRGSALMGVVVEAMKLDLVVGWWHGFAASGGYFCWSPF